MSAKEYYQTQMVEVISGPHIGQKGKIASTRYNGVNRSYILESDIEVSPQDIKRVKDWRFEGCEFDGCWQDGVHFAVSELLHIINTSSSFEEVIFNISRYDEGRESYLDHVAYKQPYLCPCGRFCMGMGFVFNIIDDYPGDFTGGYDNCFNEDSLQSWLFRELGRKMQKAYEVQKAEREE